MTKARFNPNSDYGTISPPFEGAVYSQVGPDGVLSYYDGDYRWLRSDEPAGAKAAAKGDEENFGNLAVDERSPDKGRDYSNKRPLDDPNPPNPHEGAIAEINGEALAAVKKRWIRDARANGFKMNDDGMTATDAEYKALLESDAEAQKGASMTNARPVAPAAARDDDDDQAGDDTNSDAKRQAAVRKANPYDGIDAKKGLKAWLKGELPTKDEDGKDIREPSFAEVNGWSADALGKKFTSRSQIAEYAVESGFIPAEQVKTK